MTKEIIVTVDLDETRAAVLEDDQLVELFIERPVHQRVEGNIYKGRVQNVLPGMQAAFVDIGLERNAFLYVDDALPEGAETRGGRKPSIKDVVRPGQEILVQVAKEPTGTKGARVTRHVALPGRYLVLMPGSEYIGISRRIGNEKQRERLKSLAAEVKPPGAGLIVRTVAEGASREELHRDVAFLQKVWQRIESRSRTAEAPALVHRDLELIDRVVRDLMDDEVDRLVVDAVAEYERVLDLLEITAPQLKARVRLHTGTDESLFDHYGLEAEIEKALRRRVWLKSGGYLVIDRTEALTAVDVNTGKYVGTTNLADTVLRTNLEAAREIARQLRLRDIGGIIIIDFIDMERPDHQQQVLTALEAELSRDRTRAQVLGLTQLGLVEVTRKKSRQTLDEILTRTCHVCEGRGRVVSEETMARRVRGEIRRTLRTSASEALLMEVHPGVAALLIGPGGANLRELEQELGKTIYIKGNAALREDDMHLKALGSRAEVEAQALPVRAGETLDLVVEEPHVSNPADGIARVEGYIIDIAGAGGLVGQKVRVEIRRAYRTYAKAWLLQAAPGAR